MSIVERALQKAQSKARADAATPAATPESPVEPLMAPAAATAAAASPPTAHGPGLTASPADPGLTARDLKAIVQVDVEALRTSGRLPSVAMADQTDEEMRRIKWPLLRSIAGADGVTPARNNVILVTSALPGEGKTFTSLNLALSIVRDREMRAVLVDADVARPGLTPSLGLESRAGLNDALEDVERDVSTITYQTDIEGLFFVPAGKWHPQAPEFFAGSRMPQIIAALSRRVGNGVIILDSPPLLATNEAQVATRLAGQVLLVVHADTTPQRAVMDALALVDKDAPVSAVLNRCKPSALSRYYGHYYYGYGYGYRGQYGDQGPRAHESKRERRT